MLIKSIAVLLVSVSYYWRIMSEIARVGVYAKEIGISSQVKGDYGFAGS